LADDSEHLAQMLKETME